MLFWHASYILLYGFYFSLIYSMLSFFYYMVLYYLLLCLFMFSNFCLPTCMRQLLIKRILFFFHVKLQINFINILISFYLMPCYNLIVMLLVLLIILFIFIIFSIYFRKADLARYTLYYSFFNSFLHSYIHSFIIRLSSYRVCYLAWAFIFDFLMNLYCFRVK